MTSTSEQGHPGHLQSAASLVGPHACSGAIAYGQFTTTDLYAQERQGSSGPVFGTDAWGALPSRRFNALADLLGQPYEKSFGPTDVAEPIRVFVLDHFAAYKLRAVLAEPGERIVDVVHGEHDA